MYGRWLRNSFIYLLILVAIVAIVFTVFYGSSTGTVDETLDKFISHVKAGEVTKVDVNSDTLTYKLKGEDTSYTAKMESGDYSPDFSLEWALKDLDLARAAGGVEVTPVAESIAERWRRLVAEGYGRLDVSAARKGLGSAPAGAANGQSA